MDGMGIAHQLTKMCLEASQVKCFMLFLEAELLKKPSASQWRLAEEIFITILDLLVPMDPSTS